MRYSRAIATWLLEQSRLDAGLTGDLLEERENGRSAIWYWKQVLAAVAVGTWSDIRAQKVLMLGALTTGVGTETFLWAIHNAIVSPWLPQGPMISFAPWTINLLILSITQMGTGWLIAKTHRAHAIPSLLTFLTFASTWWAYQNFSLLSRLTINSIDQPRFRIYLVYHLSSIFVANSSVLLGGLSACYTNWECTNRNTRPTRRRNSFD